MKKALVTGGAGFIGFHLARVLRKEGYQVDLLDSFSRGVRDPDLDALLEDASVRLLEHDLRDPGALDGLEIDYTHVFHLAAVIGVRHVLERPYSVLADNVAMLSTVIRASQAQRSLQRLTFTSTSEVYAGTLLHQGLMFPTPESTPLVLPDLSHPRTSYMLSKLYGESMSLLSGLPVTILRPHNFYGPRMGMSHVIPELLSRAFRAADGDSLEVHSPDHMRTFCYIDDAAQWMVRAAESEGCLGQVLNVGNETPEVRMDELAAVVARAVGRQLTIRPLKATPGSPVRRCPDTSRIVSLTGYRQSVDLEEGVRRTFDWYRDHVLEHQGITAR